MVDSAAMEQAMPAPFDPERFKQAVKERIEALGPPAQQSEFSWEKMAKQVATAGEGVRGLARQRTADAGQAIRDAQERKTSPEAFKAKEPGAMVRDRVGPAPADPGAEAAIPEPEPIPEWAVQLGLAPKIIEQRLAKAKVTEQQLKAGNEPQFDAALAARDEVRTRAEQSATEYRAHEDGVLAAARTNVAGVASAALSLLHNARAGTLGGVATKQDQTKRADEELRNEINGRIIGFHDATKDGVKQLLDAIDRSVGERFSAGEKDARALFETHVKDQTRAWYQALMRKSFAEMLEKFTERERDLNRIYAEARKLYLASMDRTVEEIARLVGFMLGLARVRILLGRAQIRFYVEHQLPARSRRLGAEVAASLDHRFEQLAADVDGKVEAVVDTVARKYVESRDHLDERIKELQEDNKGWLEKAIDAVVGAIKAIYELSKLLLRVLLKAAAAIGDIIAHPIRFFENLIKAVKGGFDRFVERIGDHLQRALLSLLGDELADTLTLPPALDFAGVVDLVLQILGLTYRDIRERFVNRFGEDVVARMEATVDIFRTLHEKGLAGLWEQIQEQLSDLYDNVVGEVRQWVIDRVVKEGIAYIVSLLTPASAFIKACQGIFRIVKFIVEKATAIAGFVDSVMDSIAAIAAGNVDGAIETIENALARGLGLAINFLARLAHLDAIGTKFRAVVERVRRPVRTVVDRIIGAAAQAFAPVAAAFTGKKVEPARKATPEAGLPAPDPSERPLQVDRKFVDGSETHHLSTRTPDAAELIVASTKPVPLSRIPDQTGTLAPLNREYVDARKKWLGAVEVRRGHTKAYDTLVAVIDKIVAALDKLGLTDRPLASAPGLGDIQRHGDKPPSLRRGPRIWWLESEHLLPFAVGKQLWQIVGQVLPKRGRLEDEHQRTIMLYFDAARIKTTAHDDRAISRVKVAWSAHLLASRRTLANSIARTGGLGTTEAWSAFLTDYEKAKDDLREVSDSAVVATKEAVATEYHVPVDGITAGDRRAERQPLPDEAEIDRAADLQYHDVVDLLDEAIEERRGQ